MGFFYRNALRRVLFGLDPETAHDAALTLAELAQSSPAALGALSRLFSAPYIPAEVAGLKLRNPVGLAAGFDKDCQAPAALAALGFGFLELGTVTLRPQNGNPRPRLFRVPEAGALINRMGFNNAGAREAAARLEAAPPAGVPVGINIGKNADVSLDDAPRNYLEALRILYPHGDFFTVNVSSPNTLGLRELHRPDRLSRLVSPLLEHAAGASRRKPLFVKISPDLSDADLESVVSAAVTLGFGLIVSNTTVSREGVPERWRGLEGGLSGRPLRQASDRLLARAAELGGGKVPLIGSGGISDGPSAARKLALGAQAVQIYSGLIYEGPWLPRDIARHLAALPSRRRDAEN